MSKIKAFIRSLVPVSLINERNRIGDKKRISKAVKYKPEKYSPEKFKRGIRFFGDTDSGTGLSNGNSMLLDMLKESGVPYSYVSISEKGKISNEEINLCDEKDYGINLFAVQPSAWPHIYAKLPQRVFDGHKNIAFWLWETPDIPEEWIPLCSWFDEIWVPSEFVAKAVRKVSSNKVRILKFGLNPSKAKLVSAEDKSAIREKYGIGNSDVVYLTMFDARSGFERKNPEGALRAYTMAFPEEKKDAWFIVKAKSAEKKQMKLLRSLLQGYKNVIWIEGMLSRKETDALIAASDVYISLHRAEGFGLPIAEAMQMGTVPVAADYSSTTEFVSPEGAIAVPCTEIAIKKDVTAYRKGTVWAEPDLKAASDAIRLLYEDADQRKRLSSGASETVYSLLSFESESELIKEYEKEIYENCN